MPPTTAEIELTITNTAKNAELILCHKRDITLRRANVEVFVMAFGNVTAGAQDHPHFVLRLLKELLAAGSLDFERQTVARTADAQVCTQRDDHEGILILAQHRTDGLERPDHRELLIAGLTAWPMGSTPLNNSLTSRSPSRQTDAAWRSSGSVK